MDSLGLSTHHVVRAAVPGFFMGVCYEALSNVGITPPLIELASPISGAAGLFMLGFVLDVLGAYKLHPGYRRIRNRFFVSLSQTAKHQPSKLKEQIALGERRREQTLYDQPQDRLADLRTEHAIWIALYHVHLIALVAGTVAVVYLVVGAREATPTGMAVTAVLFVFSALTLIAAVARNLSYNAKIFSAASGRQKKRRRR